MEDSETQGIGILAIWIANNRNGSNRPSLPPWLHVNLEHYSGVLIKPMGPIANYDPTKIVRSNESPIHWT